MVCECVVNAGPFKLCTQLPVRDLDKSRELTLTAADLMPATLLNFFWIDSSAGAKYPKPQSTLSTPSQSQPPSIQQRPSALHGRYTL
jgi:hypothetical protein